MKDHWTEDWRPFVDACFEAMGSPEYLEVNARTRPSELLLLSQAGMTMPDIFEAPPSLEEETSLPVRKRGR